MASTFLIGRFRSDTYSGTFSFPFGKNIRGALNSENGYLFFEREYVPTDMPPYPPYWRTLLCCDPTTVYLYYRDSSVGWRFQCFAFGEHKCKIIELTDGEERSSTLGPVLQTTWFLSYWSVIAPLTLISAYLLLSKNRKSTEKNTTELVPEKAE